MIDAMEQAGTTDLRAHVDLPLALRIIGRPGDSSLRRAVDQLRAWQRAGAQRRDATSDKAYEHADGDPRSWTPGGRCGARRSSSRRSAPRPSTRSRPPCSSTTSPTTTATTSARPTRTAGTATCARTCGPCSSARSAAATRASTAAAARLTRCRQVLRRSLRDAIRAARGDVYGDDEVCADEKRPSDQWCFDAVRQRPVGGATQPLIHWINRPTYQQVVEVQAPAPR